MCVPAGSGAVTIFDLFGVVSPRSPEMPKLIRLPVNALKQHTPRAAWPSVVL